ncbi:ester cyclase [Fulvivirgaceae bacterium BMA12]|uniref:Ester cyclase n=1 Tax=Agaribacillus aureus TaxID=3051825 RepID=A0ABT8LBU0_9BACT|nr:ester cyclase [Fulvivirgaceae bacterium BMA12]
MISLIHQYVKTWNTQQVESLPDLFLTSATYKDPLQEGNAVALLSNSIPQTAVAFPDVEFGILTIIENSSVDSLVLEWSMKGTNQGPFFEAPATGKRIEIFGVDIFEIKDNRISALRSFYDSNQFKTQLGL